jgi:hypothetical protein
MRALFLALPLLLVACSGTDGDTAPGGVTQGEADALNDAAAMLDADAVSPNAIDAEPKDRR